MPVTFAGTGGSASGKASLGTLTYSAMSLFVTTGDIIFAMAGLDAVSGSTTLPTISSVSATATGATLSSWNIPTGSPGAFSNGTGTVARVAWARVTAGSGNLTALALTLSTAVTARVGLVWIIKGADTSASPTLLFSNNTGTPITGLGPYTIPVDGAAIFFASQEANSAPTWTLSNTSTSTPTPTAGIATSGGAGNTNAGISGRAWDYATAGADTGTITSNATNGTYAGYSFSPPAAPTVSGAATLTATSTLTTAATVVTPTVVAGAATLSATSTLTAAATKAQPGAATLTATSTLTTAAFVVNAGAVTLTATSTLTAPAFLTQFAAVSLSATSALTAGAFVTQPAAASLTATSVLTVAAAVVKAAAATLTATSTLTTAATVAKIAAATLSATSTLTTAGIVSQPAAVSLSATSTLTAAATVITTVPGPETIAKKLLWVRGKDLGAGGSTPSPWTDQSGLANSLLANGSPVVVAGQTPAGGKVVRYAANGQNYRNLPAIATDTITATASTNFSTEPPSNAVDGSSTTHWTTNGVVTGWLRLATTAVRTLTGYGIRRRDDLPNRNPKDWTFEGSNDGSSWTVLDTQTGITWPTVGETKNFTFSNTTGYLYYRINITANNGDVTYTSITDIITTLTPLFTVTGAEMWAVIRQMGGTGINASWDFGTATQGGHYPYTDGKIYESFGLTSTNRQSFTPTMSLTSWRVYRVRNDGTTWQAWLDAVPQASASGLPYGFRTAQWSIGASIAASIGSDRWDGQAAEFLVFGDALSDADAATLYTYFNAEHGLTVAPGIYGNVLLTSTSTLTVAGFVTVAAAATLSATSTLTTTATKVQPAAASLSATSTLTTAATKVQPAAVSMTATSTLTTAATKVQPAAASLSATSTLTTAAVVTELGATVLSATSTLTASASGSGTVSAAATLSSTSTLTAAAVVAKPAAASLSATSTLTAAAVIAQPAAATLSATSALTVAGFVTRAAAATLSATSTLTAAAGISKVAAATLSATSTLTAAVTLQTRFGAVDLTSTSTLTAAATVRVVAATVLSSTSTLTANAGGTASGAAVLSASSVLTVTATVVKVAAVSMTATSTLTSTAVVSRVAAVSMTSTSTLTALARQTQFATVDLQATSTLTATARQTMQAAVLLQATSALTADATRALAAAVVLAATSTLTASGTVVGPYSDICGFAVLSIPARFAVLTMASTFATLSTQSRTAELAQSQRHAILTECIA